MSDSSQADDGDTVVIGPLSRAVTAGRRFYGALFPHLFPASPSSSASSLVALLFFLFFFLRLFFRVCVLFSFCGSGRRPFDGADLAETTMRNSVKLGNTHRPRACQR